MTSPTHRNLIVAPLGVPADIGDVHPTDLLDVLGAAEWPELDLDYDHPSARLSSSSRNLPFSLWLRLFHLSFKSCSLIFSSFATRLISFAVFCFTVSPE